MCEQHNQWCDTLKQTKSFPQPGSNYRTPTDLEVEKYGQGKSPSVPKKNNQRTSNLVVYDDVSSDGDVTAATSGPTIGVDENNPYDDPVLARVRLRPYSAAAAGSVNQPSTNATVSRGVDVVHSSPHSDISAYTQTDNSGGFSDAVLDRIEHYVRQKPLPWQVKALLPGLFRMMPEHEPSMLVIALSSIIRGIRIASEEIIRDSSSQPILQFEDRNVLILGDKLVYSMRASGAGPVL